MKIRASMIEKKDRDIILWHYTTPEVLWKMLSGEFYATHYRFMNVIKETYSAKPPVLFCSRRSMYPANRRKRLR